jgi:sensor histidine kinase YesM
MFQVLDEVTESIPSEPYNRLQDTYSSFSNHHQLIKHNNEMYLLLISNPNYEQWRMVQLIPIASLYVKTRELGLFILAMGIAGILLSIPFAYFIGKRINVPIQKIIQGMRRVEKGKFDTRVGPYYVEEYDILAKNFNQMTSQIDESLAKLKRESGYRREAEIRALQSQIMPHFLYNTLDMIHWRAMDHQAEDISLMVNQLSKMLRIGLSGGQKFILLRDELEHVKCYIHIQRARLKKEIDYKVRVPASIKGFYIPKIILQPFIENSMRHGYEQEYEGNVQIEVIAKLHNNSEKEMLEITITDYGVGLPDEWTIENAKGIGIKNVKERIWMYCGHPCNVKLFNHIMGGASVQIMLPVIKSEAELEKWTQKHKQWFDE